MKPEQQQAAGAPAPKHDIFVSYRREDQAVAKVGDEISLCVNFGLSVPLPRRSYGLTVGARYLVRPSEVVGNVVELERQLWELSAGLTWRF